MTGVSVVMGVKNGGLHVAPAVRSVLRQSFQDLELLVMDDGSTDGTAEVLEELAGSDRRVRLFHQENQGLGAALNALIARSRAPYIARLDADDACLPNRIEVQHAYMERYPQVAMAGTWAAFHYTSGGIRACQIFPDRSHWIASQLTRGRNIFVHSSVMLRRSALSRLSGPYRFRLVQDFDLWLRIVESASAGMVQQVGVVSRWHAARTSSHGVTARRQLHEAILSLHRDRLRYGLERRSVEEVEQLAYAASETSMSSDIGPDWYEAMLALYERDFEGARRRFESVVASGGALEAKARRWTTVLRLPLARLWLPALFSPLKYMVPPLAVGSREFWDGTDRWLREIGFTTEMSARNGEQ